MKNLFCLVFIFFVSACSESSRYEEFNPSESLKDEKMFHEDSALCEADKDKHSNKIQGRDFGFKGQDVGYLGCMKLRGWDRK